MPRPIVKGFVAAAVASAGALIPCCAEPAAPAALIPCSATPEVAHADAMPSSADCKYFNYLHDETKNVGGAGACAGDCDCDGMRSCSSGACQGDPRPGIDCDSPQHRWNEAWNRLGAGKCEGDCDCDGRRTCVWPPLKQRSSARSGTCEGVAR